MNVGWENLDIQQQDFQIEIEYTGRISVTKHVNRMSGI